MKKYFLLILCCINLLHIPNVEASEDFIETELFGIPTYTIDNPDNFTMNMMIEGIGFDVRDFIFDNNENLIDEDGIIFRSYHNLHNKYGDEKEVFTIVSWYSRDTITKINYNQDKNIFSGSDFLKLADALYIHDVFNESDLFKEQKDNKDAPRSYTSVINGTNVNDNTMGIDLNNIKEITGTSISPTEDVIYGKLNTNGKNFLNDIPMYEEINSIGDITYTLYDGEIIMILLYLNESFPSDGDSEALKLATHFMENDAELIGKDEENSEDYYTTYIYYSSEIDKHYDVQIGYDEFSNYEITSIGLGQWK